MPRSALLSPALRFGDQAITYEYMVFGSPFRSLQPLIAFPSQSQTTGLKVWEDRSLAGCLVLSSEFRFPGVFKQRMEFGGGADEAIPKLDDVIDNLFKNPLLALKSMMLP